MAKNVYKYCKHYGINIEGWFVNVASNETMVEGKQVLSMEELTESYSEFSVIIGHANYEEGIKFLKTVKECKNIYCLPCACYGVYDRITDDFMSKRKTEIDMIYSLCGDELSKKSLASYFEARRNEKSECMFPFYRKGTDYFNNDCINLSENETLLDVGACIGKAVWQFSDAVNGNYHKIIAIEPDEKDFEILQNEIEKRKLKKVITKQACVYDYDGKVKFSGEGEYGGIIPSANEYKCATL
jgi:hypothetical protein